MGKLHWFNDDRKYAITLVGGMGIYAIVETLRTGKYFDHGLIHPLLILGVLAAVFCAGLALRQEWSRWVGYAMLAGTVALTLWQTHLHGISLISMVTLAAAPLGLWYFWRLPITRVQTLLADPEFMKRLREKMDEIRPRVESQERWAVVLLFRQAIALDALRLSQVASRAFGKHFDLIDRYVDPVDATFLRREERRDPVVAGAAPNLVCYCPPHLLHVWVAPAPYPPLFTEGKGFDRPTRELIAEHRACIGIEISPRADIVEPVENGYAWSGKLAAELMDDSCVAICFPRYNRVIPISRTLQDALRDSDPGSALRL